MVRRDRPPRIDQWSVPGGAQELGETVEAAVQREVLEETNIRLLEPTLLDVVDLIDRDDKGAVRFHYTLIDFESEASNSDLVAGGDIDDASWIDIADVMAMPIWYRTLLLIRKSAQRRGVRTSEFKERSP